MLVLNPKPFSPSLQKKLDELLVQRTPIELGSIKFDSPLLLAPMSAICTPAFRLLMEELGAGGTVSELVSCHGINYKNTRTKDMLRIASTEKNVGLQLFGEDGVAMADAAKVAEEFGPKFIDINMGCPVRKVVTKGGGSALLKDTSKLGGFFNQIKKSINVPLTIKIRTGWDADTINATEIIHIAKEEGIEFVAIHGRTRTQQYTGLANWDLLEQIAEHSPLPIIGNGDLHSSLTTKERMQKTNCQALMLGRGPLRNPFIFLESYLDDPTQSPFTASDYWEIINRYYDYLLQSTERERTVFVQMKKLIVWFISGFKGASSFRNVLFASKSIDECLKLTEDYLLGLTSDNFNTKFLDASKPFMAGGHG